MENMQEKYLKEEFHPSANIEEFPENERRLLYRRGAWLKALSLREIEPVTDEQAKFVSLCLNLREKTSSEILEYISNNNIENEYVRVWLKYMYRLRFQLENREYSSGKSSVDWGFQGKPVGSISGCGTWAEINEENRLRIKAVEKNRDRSE